MKYQPRDEKPAWNFNLAFLERLDRRCDERDIASSEGDLLKWYRTLRVIYRNVHFKIMQTQTENTEKEELKKNEKDKDVLTTKFEAIKTQLLNNSNYRGSISKEVHNANLTEIEIALDELDILLNDTIHKYGLLFPEDFRKLEEEIEGDY